MPRAAQPCGIQETWCSPARCALRLARRGIMRIDSGQCAQQNRGIAYGARHRPGRILAVREIGMMPERLISPTVGLIPTTPFMDDGHTIEPSVSVPIATAQRLADAAAPDPELEPHGLRSSA